MKWYYTIFFFVIGFSCKEPSKRLEQKNEVVAEEAKFIDDFVQKKRVHKDLVKMEKDLDQIEEDTLDLPQVSASSEVKILTPGEFHSREVWEEAINQNWFGLFTSEGNAVLRNVKPSFERIKDVILDDDDEKTGWKISFDNDESCILLITGLDLQEGLIVSIEIENLIPKPLDTILLTNNSKLIIDGIRKNESVVNYKMKLRSDKAGEVLEQILVAKYGFDDEMIDIIWIGDLDRDGSLDFLIDTSRHYNMMVPTLFLSSLADENSLVECVAIFETVGC